MAERTPYDPGKHIEIVERVVERLAANSFMIKGWAITLATLIGGFAADRDRHEIALIGLVPAAAFWLLDAYYLRLERLFRCLADDIATNPGRETYSMDPTAFWSQVEGWPETLFTGAVALIHMAIAGSLVLAAVLIAA